jgi:type IV secretion system protein VirB1
MILDIAAFLALAAHCAPQVAPETLLAVSRAESGLNPLAIGVNRGALPPAPPRSVAEASEVAARLLASGANIDLGLAQINSANLARLGLSVEAAFDPCHNLRASADLLAGVYADQSRAVAAPQAALRRALSIYNTGDPARGFHNGYVARVEAAAGARVPAASTRTAATEDAPRRPGWAVFGAERPAGFVISPPPVSSGALP